MLIFSCGIIQSLIRQERIIFTGCGLTRNYPFLTKSLKIARVTKMSESGNHEVRTWLVLNVTVYKSAKVYYRVRFQLDGLEGWKWAVLSKLCRSIWWHLIVMDYDSWIEINGFSMRCGRLAVDENGRSIILKINGPEPWKWIILNI